jgi:transposase
VAKRRSYSKEFKEEAVRLAEANGFSQTARDLDVHVSLLHKWGRHLEKNGKKAFPGKGNPRDEHIARIERENVRLREEVAILKKAVGIFSKIPH